jgi:excisionase family DNA binding protein
MAGDDLLTLPEIAEMTGMNPSSVRAWVTQRLLPASRADGTRAWLVRREDLEELLATRPDLGKPRTGRRPQDDPPRDSSDERHATFDIASVLSADRRPR